VAQRLRSSGSSVLSLIRQKIITLLLRDLDNSRLVVASPPTVCLFGCLNCIFCAAFIYVLFICRSYQSICLSVRMSLCLSVCLYVCEVFLFIDLSSIFYICMSVCLSFSMSVWLSHCLSICLLSLSVCLSVCLSICLLVGLVRLLPCVRICHFLFSPHTPFFKNLISVHIKLFIVITFSS